MLIVPGRYWLSLGLVSLAVCKGGGDGATVQEVCEVTLSCSCSMPAYATVEACVTDYNAEEDESRDLAAANGVTFNEGCYSAFLAQMQSIGCETIFPGAGGSCSDNCALMYGDKPIDAVCRSFGDFDQFSDCAEGLSCVEGKCLDRCERLAAGEACSDGGSMSLGTCADDLYCDFFDSKTCKASKNAGDACSDFNECKAGLRCGDGGTCEAAPTEGESCMNVCAAGLYCDGIVCVAPPREGEACTGACGPGLDCEDNVCVVSEPLLCNRVFLE